MHTYFVEGRRVERFDDNSLHLNYLMQCLFLSVFSNTILQVNVLLGYFSHQDVSSWSILVIHGRLIPELGFDTEEKLIHDLPLFRFWSRRQSRQEVTTCPGSWMHHELMGQLCDKIRVWNKLCHDQSIFARRRYQFNNLVNHIYIIFS